MDGERRSGWHELSIESEALRGNRLGDPHARPLFVWTPPSYETAAPRRYPSIYLLQGMFGQARGWFNVSPFARNVPEEIDELAPEAIVVLVDGFTSVGGAQWLDSPATGRYGTYLCDEVVPFVDARFRTAASPEHRGICGKSSGGFGAMTWGMLRPDLFGGFATHAGDGLFEVTVSAEFPKVAQELRNRYDGSYDRFWEDFRSGRRVFESGVDPMLANTYAEACAYSPRDDGTVDLPFRVDTGERVPEVWERWLARDPVRLAATTETPCAGRARSGSTPGATTSTASTSRQPRSSTPSWPPAPPPTASSSSSTRARTAGRTGATA